jgi:probable rRNA maturation factor
MLPAVSLSLQFGILKDAPAHRTALSRDRAHRWIVQALERDAEITVRIVDEAEGRALNRQYRGKDHATNVLTFDYARAPVVIADLVLCAPVVAREARMLRKPLAEHYAHLLIHGTLHAQGWDHETCESDAEAMETLESLLMLALGWPDPYA